MESAKRQYPCRLILLCLFASVTTLAQTDWDHPTVSPGRRPPPQPRPAAESDPARATPLQTPRPSPKSAHIPPHLYSVLLDAPTKPMYRYELGVASGAKLESGNKSGQIELDLDHHLAHFINLLRGDADVRLALHTTLFFREIDHRFPRYVTRLAFDAGWIWRYLNGRSFEIRAYPGIYGEHNAAMRDLASVPFRLLLHQAIHPDLAGVVGVEVRPGWERVYMPMGGIVWEPYPQFRTEILLPRSRVSLMLGRATLFGTGEWRNWSYAMGEDAMGAAQITLDDYALSLGAGWRFTDELEFSIEAGRLVHRSLDTDSPADRPIGIDDASFVRIALVGPF